MQTKTENIEKDYSVCRTCLTPIRGISFRLQEQSGFGKGLMFTHILRYIVPELYLGLSNGPELCYDCKESLRTAYAFRKRCLETETLIGDYLKNMRCTAKVIELSSVIEYVRQLKGNLDAQNILSDWNEDSIEDIPQIPLADLHTRLKSKPDMLPLETIMTPVPSQPLPEPNMASILSSSASQQVIRKIRIPKLSKPAEIAMVPPKLTKKYGIIKTPKKIETTSIESAPPTESNKENKTKLPEQLRRVEVLKVCPQTGLFKNKAGKYLNLNGEEMSEFLIDDIKAKINDEQQTDVQELFPLTTQTSICYSQQQKEAELRELAPKINPPTAENTNNQKNIDETVEAAKKTDKQQTNTDNFVIENSMNICEETGLLRDQNGHYFDFSGNPLEDEQVEAEKKRAKIRGETLFKITNICTVSDEEFGNKKKKSKKSGTADFEDKIEMYQISKQDSSADKPKKPLVSGLREIMKELTKPLKHKDKTAPVQEQNLNLQKHVGNLFTNAAILGSPVNILNFQADENLRIPQQFTPNLQVPKKTNVLHTALSNKHVYKVQRFIEESDKLSNNLSSSTYIKASTSDTGNCLKEPNTSTFNNGITTENSTYINPFTEDTRTDHFPVRIKQEPLDESEINADIGGFSSIMEKNTDDSQEESNRKRKIVENEKRERRLLKGRERAKRFREKRDERNGKIKFDKNQKRERKLQQGRERSKRYREKKKNEVAALTMDAANSSSDFSSDSSGTKMKKERQKQNSKRYRNKKKAKGGSLWGLPIEDSDSEDTLSAPDLSLEETTNSWQNLINSLDSCDTSQYVDVPDFVQIQNFSLEDLLKLKKNKTQDSKEVESSDAQPLNSPRQSVLKPKKSVECYLPDQFMYRGKLLVKTNEGYKFDETNSSSLQGTGTKAQETDKPQVKEIAIRKKNTYKVLTVRQEKKIPEQEQLKPEPDRELCVLFTNYTLDGVYVNDHDYLSSPYIRNNLLFIENKKRYCMCYICGLKHLLKDHVIHMNSHRSTCPSCLVRLGTPYMLNLHMRNHSKPCKFCTEVIPYPLIQIHMSKHAREEEEFEDEVYKPVSRRKRGGTNSDGDEEVIYPSIFPPRTRNRRKRQALNSRKTRSSGKSDESVENKFIKLEEASSFENIYVRKTKRRKKNNDVSQDTSPKPNNPYVLLERISNDLFNDSDVEIILNAAKDEIQEAENLQKAADDKMNIDNYKTATTEVNIEPKQTDCKNEEETDFNSIYDNNKSESTRSVTKKKREKRRIEKIFERNIKETEPQRRVLRSSLKKKEEPEPEPNNTDDQEADEEREEKNKYKEISVDKSLLGKILKGKTTVGAVKEKSGSDQTIVSENFTDKKAANDGKSSTETTSTDEAVSDEKSTKVDDAPPEKSGASDETVAVEKTEEELMAVE